MSVIVATVAIQKAVTKAVNDYRNDPKEFIADYVAPPVNVQNVAGYFPRFGRKHQKLLNLLVSPTSPSPRIDHDLSTTEFTCEVHRGAMNLPSELKEFDDTGMLNAANLGILTDEAIRIEREYALSVFLSDNTNFTNTGTPTTLWDATGGNPAESINETGKAAIKTSINKTAKYGLCTFDVAMFLMQFVADLRVGGGNASLATLDEVAKYMGLKEIQIIGAGYDSAVPGATSVAGTLGGTKDFWLFHKPEQMNQFAPCFLATARYPKLSTARVWTTDDPQGIMIESRDCYDLVEVDETACYFFENVIG